MRGRRNHRMDTLAPPRRSLRHVTATPEIEVRQEETETGGVRFAGYGVRWGEVATIYDWWFGEFTEEFRKGSWKKTIAERGPNGNGQIKYCRQHNYQIALAARYLDLREDDTGLYYEAETIDTTVGRDLAEELRSGVINSNSVGWDSLVEEFNHEEDHRIIIEAKGYEISAVNWPAYEGATIDAVRALEQLPGLLEVAERQLRGGAVPPGVALERMEELRDRMSTIIESTRGAGPGDIPPAPETEALAAHELGHAATLRTELDLIEAELDL